MKNALLLKLHARRYIIKSLQVRELPEHIYARLKDEARNQHRSLAQQAIVTLAKGLGMEENPRERRRKLLSGLKRIKIGKNIKPADIVKSIREDRDR